jgi:hypothetical protein
MFGLHCALATRQVLYHGKIETDSQQVASPRRRIKLHVQINVGLPPDLLDNIQNNIEGKSRNAKILTCLEKGFKEIMSATNPREGQR